MLLVDRREYLHSLVVARASLPRLLLSVSSRDTSRTLAVLHTVLRLLLGSA